MVTVLDGAAFALWLAVPATAAIAAIPTASAASASQVRPLLIDVLLSSASIDPVRYELHRRRRTWSM